MILNTVSHEQNPLPKQPKLIAKPSRKNNNLPKKVLSQLEKSGVKMNYFLMPNTNIMAARENPIERLFEKKFLNRAEYAAGKFYQKKFELSQISNHSRPSYDGTPISSASTRKTENTPTQAHMSTCRYLFEARLQVILANNILNEKLPEILEHIFEREIAIRNVELILGINHQLIKERIKKICHLL